MSDRISSSKLSFGDLAIGHDKSVALNFLPELDISNLPQHVLIVGQSVQSFLNATDANAELKSGLVDLLPSNGGQPKGWSGTSIVRLGGSKVRLHVVVTPNEASRHNNQYRTDSVTKSLIGLLPDVIGEASKLEDDNRVVVICAVPNAQAIASTAFAVARSLPRFTRKTDRGKDLDASKPTVNVDVSFFVESKEVVDPSRLESIATVAHSIRMSQSLTDTPTNELNTTTYVEFVQKVVKSLNSGIDVKIVKGRDLESQGFGGIWSVGRGNTSNPPAMVVLSKKGTQSSGSDGSIVLVGKGIVYDCGGLSIKATAGMCGMKSDMTGSSSMFAAFVALVKMGGLKEDLHCILCLAENSIGPESFRNDDIIKLYSGMTVEINNTDAEGRLVLADGCSYAVKHLNPRLVLDMATLTGAQGVATGQNHAAVLSAFDEEETELIKAGKLSGDLAFPILFCPEFHRPNYKSEVADMKNSVSNRMDAVSSASGWFIYEHMNAAGYTGRWAHIDMAGPATFTGTGRGTGYGVGLVCSFLRPDIL